MTAFQRPDKAAVLRVFSKWDFASRSFEAGDRIRTGNETFWRHPLYH